MSKLTEKNFETESGRLLREWMPLWALPILVIFAIGTVALRLSIVRQTYAIDQAERQIKALKQAHENMELKVAGLRSPRRLEVIARSHGLTQPRTDQVIYMSQSAPLRAESSESKKESKKKQ